MSIPADAIVAGIDEAGRGPVLGPMVYGIAWTTKGYEKELKKMGFTDSKQLTPEKREELFSWMKGTASKDIRSESISLSAREISARMLDADRQSLNELAVDATFALIDEMLKQLEGKVPDMVYVDTLGNPERHKEKLSRRFPSVSFTVESKADVNYPVVSAASIVAKVTRDQELEHSQGGGEMQGDSDNCATKAAFGSGYPSDPVTKAWLSSHIDHVFGFPPVVRFSWQTCTTCLKDNLACKVSWDCDDDEDNAQQQKLWAPASQTASGESSGMGRHSFFRSRKLQKLCSSF